jgi:hypothetical protein
MSLERRVGGPHSGAGVALGERSTRSGRIDPVEIMWKNGGSTVEVVSAKIFLSRELARSAAAVSVDPRFAPTFA